MKSSRGKGSEAGVEPSRGRASESIAGGGREVEAESEKGEEAEAIGEDREVEAESEKGEEAEAIGGEVEAESEKGAEAVLPGEGARSAKNETRPAWVTAASLKKFASS